ncbi:MAG: YdcF family protein [Gallionellaceae bacterium]|jgi:uncharacterized SAM-binding protein YcdF (DUF218 family)
MSWFFTNLVAAVLLPPLNLLVMSLAGLLLWRKRPRLARILLSSAFFLLWLLSTPFMAESLLRSLEAPPLKLTENTVSAEAIIVLGGGSYLHAPEYAGDTVGTLSLERVRYAAHLYRNTGKPILLSGGTPLGNSISEARLMKQALEQELNTPVQWLEEESNNTLENARYSYRLLQKAGIKRIYLVTHAWHMPRSSMVFQVAGFEVIAAPTAFTTRHTIDLLAFIPNAGALYGTQIFLHEALGILWYRLKS